MPTHQRDTFENKTRDPIKFPGTIKSEKGNLPNLIIIGAQKCATTSLHYYLNLHPQISMSREKELDFFIAERNWQKGVGWYKSNFTGEALLYGESSPSYTTYPLWKGVPERMYSLIPDAKLIYIVRDPVERIISGYLHSRLKSGETRTIGEVLRDFENNRHVLRSRYFMQLGQYLQCYPKSNILVITLEDLHNHTHETLKKVFRYLNVEESFYSPKFKRIVHKTSDIVSNNRFNGLLRRLSETGMAKRIPTVLRVQVGGLLSSLQPGKAKRPVLNERLRKELIDYLRDDINRLREFTGHDFEGWCV
ncbi:MAG TPA: sulfotransferase domain-containing protein [Thermodesulfobacteriota bacterium]|nr:sulfotransferase domain-containing protein [Thermodesulfobacteriota bacterium]